MSTETAERPRLQDDPEVLAYQFINTIEGANGEVRLGGTAYLRDGLTWDEVLDGVSRRKITQFVNGKVIVWRVARTEGHGDEQGFRRF